MSDTASAPLGLKRWFVYSGTSYYPSCEVVEAENAHAAVLKAYPYGDRPILVFPYDSLALKLGMMDDDEDRE